MDMMLEMNTTNYRTMLASAFAVRCARNERYSQAAFARDIGISPSLLSEVLSDQHDLSRRKAEVVARRLGFTPTEFQAFCDSAEAQSSRSANRRNAAQLRLSGPSKGVQPDPLREEKLKAMGEWFHIAIIEALKIVSDGMSAIEVGKRLRLQPSVVRTALSRLKRLGLVEENDGRWFAKNKRLIVEGGVPSDTLKHLHEQFVIKAQKAIFGQHVDQRYLTTAVIPIPRAKVKEAFSRLDQMRKDFCDGIHTFSEQDSIYCLSLQFFELMGEHSNESR